jgi:hypothetical protein
VKNHARFAVVAMKSFLTAHRVTVVPSLAAARLALNASAFDVALVDYATSTVA